MCWQPALANRSLSCSSPSRGAKEVAALVSQLSDVADSLAKTMHRHMAREEAGALVPGGCCMGVLSGFSPSAPARLPRLLSLTTVSFTHACPPPADVLPVLMRTLCMAEQRHMVWRILRAMPLRLLERVMPWVAGERPLALHLARMLLAGLPA